MPTSREHREHVRRVVLPAHDTACGTKHEWHVRGPVARGREGLIFEAHAENVSVAVKLFHAQSSNSLRMAERIEAQRRYATAMRSSSGVSVAEPLAHLPAERAVVLDWVDAPTVARVVGLHGLIRRNHTGLLTRAGRWLGAFHRCDWAGVRVVLGEQELGRLDRRLAKHGRGQTLADLDAELPWARQQLAVLARKMGPVPHARLHGDFKPSNLASDSQRTIGFDVAGLAVGPVTRDICRFLVHAEVDRKWLRLPRPGLGNPEFDPETIATFMAGYAQIAEPIDERALRTGLLAEALLLWITLAARPTPSARRPIRALRVWRLRHMIRGLADETVALLPQRAS